jgi:hypothetical protein
VPQEVNVIANKRNRANHDKAAIPVNFRDFANVRNRSITDTRELRWRSVFR